MGALTRYAPRPSRYSGAIEVHRNLGPGFLEAVYQEAMEIELSARGIPFDAQKPIQVRYKGQILNKQYVADLVCFDLIIVELKALDRLSGNEQAQVLNYLKATEWVFLSTWQPEWVFGNSSPGNSPFRLGKTGMRSGL